MGFFTNDGGSGGGGVSDHGGLTGLGDDDHTQYSLISSGSGAPGTTPSRVGEVYIDTTADEAYISTGTASSADWTLTSDGGGEVNTLSGAGAAESLFYQKVGVDLQMKDLYEYPTGGISINNLGPALGIEFDIGSFLSSATSAAAADLLTIKSSTTNKKITFANLEASLDVENLTNYSTLTTADSTTTFTNKTFDANGTGNSLSNVDVADLANGTDGELITWSATGAPTTVAVGTANQVLTSNGAGAAPTFQDAAGGGNPARGEHYGSSLGGSANYIVHPDKTGSTTGSQFPDRTFYTPVIIGASETYTRIGCEVTTALAGQTTRLAIYEADTDGDVGALVLDAGTVDGSTTGVKEITISETLHGKYYLAIVNANSGTYNLRKATFIDRAAYFGQSSSTSTGALTNAYKIASGDATGFADPAGSVSRNTGDSLLVWLRKV